MRIVSCVTALLCLSSASALACLPPPLGYFQQNEFRAVINSGKVINKFGNQRVHSIQLTDQGIYVVSSKHCALSVRVEVKQEGKGPCGGYYTFTAVPLGEITCIGN